MKYVLDTNTIIYFIKGQYPQLDARLRHTPSQEIFIPSIVVSEIEYGARKSNDYEKTIQVYRQFLEAFTIVPYDGRMGVFYALIRASLEKQGEKIDPNDLIIAAETLAMGGTLVTKNLSEFRRVEGLRVEDWTV